MHDSREGGVRVKHDCMDAGGRATHGAVAEEARTEEQLSRITSGTVIERVIISN